VVVKAASRKHKQTRAPCAAHNGGSEKKIFFRQDANILPPRPHFEATEAIMNEERDTICSSSVGTTISADLALAQQQHQQLAEEHNQCVALVQHQLAIQRQRTEILYMQRCLRELAEDRQQAGEVLAFHVLNKGDGWTLAMSGLGNSTTVRHINDYLAWKHDIEPDAHVLVYNGRVLRAERTLVQCNITNNTTLHLIKRIQHHLQYPPPQQTSIMLPHPTTPPSKELTSHTTQTSASQTTKPAATIKRESNPPAKLMERHRDRNKDIAGAFIKRKRRIDW
jgi:hypothetical protein